MTAVQPYTSVDVGRCPRYAGLRMTADEYLDLVDDGFKYELIDGVIVLSPSATPKHQQVMIEIVYQLKAYLRDHPVGSIFAETDVRFDSDLVYRPETVFIRADRVRENWQRIHQPPDVILEVVSPDSRRYDSETKKEDYERYGVTEYWLIDPYQETMAFFRLRQGRYFEVPPTADRVASEAVPGFSLDLAAVRRSFQPY